jgi:hypothetical protein
MFPLLLATLAVSIVFILACSKSPVDTEKPISAANIDTEYKSLEADYLALATADSTDTTNVRTERRIMRLRLDLQQMERLLNRIANFEQKHPNQGAQEQILLAQQELSTAQQEYNNGNFLECLNHYRLANQYIHQALKLLCPPKTEYGRLESDYFILVRADSTDSTKAPSERQIIQLRLELQQLERLLNRLAEFEQKYPNQDAHIQIQLVQQELTAAQQAYLEQNFQECLNHYRLARQYLYQAMKLLCPANRPVTRPGNGRR